MKPLTEPGIVFLMSGYCNVFAFELKEMTIKGSKKQTKFMPFLLFFFFLSLK